MRHVAALLVATLTLTRPAAAQKQEYNRPEDCEVTAWSDWSACTVTLCGGGTQTRSREIKKKARYGGDECPALEQTRACNQTKCFSFLLMGNTGDEQVYVESDGE